MEKFSIQQRLKSFQYAIAGLKTMLRSQHNAWLHALATVAVIALSAVVGLSGMQWCIIILCIGLVWSAEAVNTALEALCDVVHPEQHPKIRVVKDVAAAAVLLVSIAAALIGAIIFLPYFI